MKNPTKSRSLTPGIPAALPRRRMGAAPAAVLPLLLSVTAVYGCQPAAEKAAEEEAATVTAALSSEASKDLYVVAHQDDDLLFMAPEVGASIERGNQVWVVYLTAGDAGESASYWRDGREVGIESAYANMAGVDNNWTTDALSLAGEPVHSRTLNGTNVRLVFMRLPDGGDKWGNGNASTGYQSLSNLWAAPSTAIIDSVDDISHFSRASLILALGDVLTELEPSRISVLDPTARAHGEDHYDHIYSARFMLAARQGYDKPHAFKMHRTYNIVDREPNLTEAQEAKKTEAFTHYVVHDSHLGFSCGGEHHLPADCNVIGDYGRRLSRHYPKSGVQGIAGRVTGHTGNHGACLVDAGTGVEGAVCTSGNYQEWSVNHDYSIMNESGKCLTGHAPFADGSPVTLETCNGSPSQRFTLLSDGRILGPDAQCLDMTTGYVHLYHCRKDVAQRWVVEAKVPTEESSSGDDFSATHLGTDPTKMRAFGLADVNGDTLIDACVRRHDGVWCALQTNTSTSEVIFSEWQPWTTDFSDAEGWQKDKYGPTLEFADINGDGKADVCGRGYHGFQCAHSTGASFGALAIRTNSFSHSSGYSPIHRAHSVHLADVNDDDFPDVCGRSADGIECALNDKTGFFGDAVLWLEDEFSDGKGWDHDEHGATIMFGDINGDGSDDVCGRGISAVFCATSTGSHFEPSRWSHAFDYSNWEGWASDVAYFGSLRLADIDGDGRADLCGRAPNGLWCSISQGTASFDEKRLIFPGSFDDASGWKQAYRGATIQWADLDGDGHADPCGLGPDGIVCSHAP